MGFNISKHSEDEVMREKRSYEQMSLEDRRRHYHPYKTLADILPWIDYYNTRLTPRGEEINRKQMYSRDDIINGKVSLFSGDITELEIDAIVNSTSKSIFRKPKGEVNNAVYRKAGEYYLDECIITGLGGPGEATVTGGYTLPARYVVNTFAPRQRDTSVLSQCYTKSLEAARSEGLRTIAFPCIGVKKQNSFGREKAAKVALKSVRTWMETNHSSMDRVIFCVFQVEDLVHYNWLMQEYFPVTVVPSALPKVGGPAPSTSGGADQGASGGAPATTRQEPVQKRNKSQIASNKKFLILQQKTMFLRMSIEEKRRQYLTKTHVERTDIQAWPEYHRHNLANISTTRSTYVVNPDINRMVALCYGDIAELEVDAVVNSAATREQGGQVNTAILDAAGDTYREECEMSIYHLKPGQAGTTGGYRLPAKYVINTVAPKHTQEAVLANCYTSALTEAKQIEHIHILAFPCIATRKRHRIDKRAAANIALRSTREWLEDNVDAVELVIFCVYTKEDLDIYEELLQFYFPVTGGPPMSNMRWRRTSDSSGQGQLDGYSLSRNNNFNANRFQSK